MDFAAMGSADHHMALSFVGAAEKSLPGNTNPAYRDAVMRWQARALQHVNKRLGFVPVTIEHQFHGRKQDRKYTKRWDMFVEHQFNPITDLKRNTWGVIEFAGNKPDLEKSFEQYLRSREEDSNISA